MAKFQPLTIRTVALPVDNTLDLPSKQSHWNGAFAAEALEMASEQFDGSFGSRISKGVKPVAVVFTDGFSASDPVPAAAKLLDKV